MKDKNTREAINIFKDAIRQSPLSLRVNFSKERYKGLLKEFLNPEYGNFDKSPIELTGKEGRFYIKGDLPHDRKCNLISDKVFYSPMDWAHDFIYNTKVGLENFFESFGEENLDTDPDFIETSPGSYEYIGNREDEKELLFGILD